MVAHMLMWPVSGVVRRLEKLGRWLALNKARAVLSESLFLVVQNTEADMYPISASFASRNIVSVYP